MSSELDSNEGEEEWLGQENAAAQAERGEHQLHYKKTLCSLLLLCDITRCALYKGGTLGPLWGCTGPPLGVHWAPFGGALGLHIMKAL